MPPRDRAYFLKGTPPGCSALFSDGGCLPQGMAYFLMGNACLKAGLILKRRPRPLVPCVGLLPVEGEFVGHDFFTEGDTLLILRGCSRNLILNVLEAFLQALQGGEPLKRDVLLNLRGGPLTSCDQRYRRRGTLLPSLFETSTFNEVIVRVGTNIATYSHTAVVIMYCMAHRSPGGSPSPPPKEVYEEVLWRGDSVSRSAGVGGPRTIAPLEGAVLLARDKKVPS
ncbi:UNVERIFIED_CONTAM: hypothetical protein Slati_2226400 [Sesamum latifolium]|uniref:Uncharacterized protein n=1 Tax=Sesamum latifolium TaxID=2727402 RepID=A0AAW2WWZ7_9LAMI